MKQKLQTLLTELNHGLVEREATLKTALLTVLAGENLVLIGPPGTGKSLIARRIADSFAHDGNNGYFEYLLTKFSTPEEIFGPLSITELKADRFKRNTAGYLPTVKMAFLDEIFKASSSILNALLTILNERVYHNGSEPQKVPMQALIAASNELPTDQEELSALYDRFLVRGFVDYVSQDKLPLLFANAGPMPALTTQLNAADLKSIQAKAEAVTIPPEIAQAVQHIWIQHKETFKEDRRESLSDRRLKKVIKLLCVSAVTNGRSEVNLSDVFLLKDCLWNHKDNALKVRDLSLNILRSFSRSVPQGQDAIKATPASTPISGKLGTVVKGFKGSGTEQNPLLIQTVEDLMDLSRPDVGMQNYYFQQTSDIDGTILSSWTAISFKGHYDGSNHTIKFNKKESNNNPWENKETTNSLFSNIQMQSSITNLKLENLILTVTAENSHITNCSSNQSLIENQATKCTIINCQSENSLIGGATSNCCITDCQSNINLINSNTNDCTITSCRASNSLIQGTTSNCTIISCQTGNSLIDDTAICCKITDCLIVNSSRTNLTDFLSEGSLIERCFITWNIERRFFGNIDSPYFSGIAYRCSDSTIRQCAVGRLISSTNHDKWEGRIIKFPEESSTLENNASIDSNPGKDESNGKDGKTVAAALFKQRYFEYTLGWDFDTVWQWDNKEDRPALRSVGVGAASQHTKPAAQQANMVDLLTQQISANIWL
ncbi:MAG: AAA family ATPase [Polaromonas sp.]|nr:AAA family ATPase [Polaromonas sp.]